MQKIIVLMLLSLLAGPALAHHLLAGMPVTTFAHGLMSGFGHPILGFDHLFFVTSVGIIAIFTRHRILAPQPISSPCSAAAWLPRCGPLCRQRS
ncbi:MAG: hypothetical protein GY785_04090 [Gammaproteobacteria bacterium]|nr:hypothetical protein [Gammaproteobacteria bacterium]